MKENYDGEVEELEEMITNIKQKVRYQSPTHLLSISISHSVTLYFNHPSLK